MVAEPLSKQTGERAYHNWRERCIEFCQLWVSRCYVLDHFFYLILFFVYSPFTFVLACQGIGETTGLLEISVTDAFFPVIFPTKRDLCQRFAKISLILSFFLHPFGCGLCFLLIKKI